MKLLKSSLLYLEIEKLSILQKELKYLYLICDYYSSDDNTQKKSSEKKDLEHNFSVLKEQIKILYKSIKNNGEDIAENIKIIKKDGNDDSYHIQFLIYLDYVRAYTKYKLNRLNLISMKISQSLRSGYNQYIPKPMAGKRFSNLNITSEVEFALSQRLKKLLNNNSNDILPVETMIVWDYNDDYTIERYVDSNDNKDIHLTLNLSYWYFEFPYFLPNLTHELGHVIVDSKQKDNDYYKLKNRIKQNIINAIQKDTIDEDIIRELIDFNIIEEVVSDIMALIYHGNSYIFSLSHKKLGLNLHTSFKSDRENITNGLDEVINIKGLKISEDPFLISPMQFDVKRDSMIIRFMVILYVRELLYDTHWSKKERFKENNFNIINNIKILLNSIYAVDDIKESNSSLKCIFNSFHNYLDSYEGVKEIVKEIFNGIKKAIDLEEKLIIKILNKQENLNKQKNNNLKIPNNFTEIWEKRFELLKEDKEKETYKDKKEAKVMHRYEYRKKLHKTLIEKLNDKKLLTNSDTLIPYSLSMIKLRVDKLNSYPNDINGNCTKQQDTHNTIECEHGVVLGIYDHVVLRKLDSKYTPVIRENIEDNKYSFFKKKEKYYESFFSLMKIINDTKGNKKSEDEFGAFIQIEVEKQLKGDTIYKELFEDIIELHSIIEEHKENFRKVEYFKSLGPKDLIIHIDNISLDNLYKIKEAVYQKFSRTYTTIYFKKYDNIKDKPFESSFYITTHIRLSSENSSFKGIYDEYIKKGWIKEVYLITGILDYLLVWKKDIKLSELVEFYNKLIKNHVVYDIQTSLEKLQNS